MGGATFGGVIGALEPVDSGMVGLDEKVRLVFPFRPICFFGTGIFPYRFTLRFKSNVGKSSIITWSIWEGYVGFRDCK